MDKFLEICFGLAMLSVGLTGAAMAIVIIFAVLAGSRCG